MSTFTHDTKDTADTSVLLVTFEILFSHCCIATLMESFFHNYTDICWCCKTCSHRTEQGLVCQHLDLILETHVLNASRIPLIPPEATHFIAFTLFPRIIVTLRH